MVLDHIQPALDLGLSSRLCFLFCFFTASSYLFFKISFILAVLGFGCCVGFSLVVHGLLAAAASLGVEQFLGAQASVVSAHGLSICDSRAPEHRLKSCSVRAYLLQCT